MVRQVAPAVLGRWFLPSGIALLSLACGDLRPIGVTDTNEGGTQGGIPDGSVAERILTPNQRDTLGRTCATDADCPLLTCVKPTDKSMGGGGPAHGYCSTPCTTADDPICKVADGKCLNFAQAGVPEQNWCVQTCRRGGEAPDVNKCRGRTDVACTPSSVSNGQPSIDGYCLPTCNSDADCEARHCDPSSGVCLDAVIGDPSGTPCSSPGSIDGGADANGDEGVDADIDGGADEDANKAFNRPRSTDCAGVCLAVGASTHVCAQRCTYGTPNACNLPKSPIDAGAAAFSACIFVSKNTGPGDEAHCGQLCDVDADCLDQLDPGVSCNKSDVALKAFGHGYCDWAPPILDAAAETQ